MLKKIGLYCILMGIMLPSVAQMDVQLSQHMFNRIHYNPAVTGASRYVNIVGNIRDQWSGWKGAPHSRVITFHNYFDRIASGLGMTFIGDEIGLENLLTIKFSYAYHVQLSGLSYLSLGLSGGILHRYFDRSDLYTEDFTDTDLPLDIERKTYADFDVGLEWHISGFTLGASVTHVTASRERAKSTGAGRHYYVFAKYLLPVAYRWQLEPAVFVQKNKQLFHSEASLLVHYNHLFWFGLSFRVDTDFKPESFVPILGVDITDFLRLSYSYDVNIGALRNYTNGAHELLVGIRIRKNPSHYSKSPRFFE